MATKSRVENRTDSKADNKLVSTTVNRKHSRSKYKIAGRLSSGAESKVYIMTRSQTKHTSESKSEGTTKSNIACRVGAKKNS